MEYTDTSFISTVILLQAEVYRADWLNISPGHSFCQAIQALLQASSACFENVQNEVEKVRGSDDISRGI
jgi:hypothetical protein